MAIEIVPLLLSSRAEVESIFSVDGIDLRIDDGDDGVTDGTAGTTNDVQFLIDALIEASDVGYQRLLIRYDETPIGESLWVRRRASYIACHVLSTRKGNPAQYCTQYERYLKEFDDAGKGITFIPRTKPRGNFQPTLSNLAVSHWNLYQTIRTMQDNAEGPRDPKQFDDVRFGYRGWFFAIGWLSAMGTLSPMVG